MEEGKCNTLPQEKQRTGIIMATGDLQGSARQKLIPVVKMSCLAAIMSMKVGGLC